MSALLAALGLPTELPAALDATTLGHVRADKKRAGDAVRFVVPGAPGRVEVVAVPFAALDAALGADV
jgi:3-dehydroquinate synthetase